MTRALLAIAIPLAVIAFMLGFAHPAQPAEVSLEQFRTPPVNGYGEYREFVDSQKVVGARK